MAGDLEAVQKLIDNPPQEFQEIKDLLNEPNLFRILGMQGMEIRHSNFLAYLMDPKGNHGLGTLFLREFLIRCKLDIDIQNLDLDSFVVTREDSSHDVANNSRRMDILLINAADKIVICIENKITSLENNNQLSSYGAILERDYGGYTKVYIYLTPTKEAAKEPWVKVNYGAVLETAEECYRQCDNLNIKPSVKQYINDYISVVRRDIMNNDNELRLKCLEAYKQNRQAISAILTYIKNPLTAVIEGVLNKKEQEGKIIKFRGATNRKQNSEFKFSTKELEEICKPVEGGVSEYWKTGHKILYNIIVENQNGQPFKIHFTAMLSSLSGEDGDIIFKIMGIKKEKGKNSKVFDTKINVTNDDNFIGDVQDKIENFIDDYIPTFEKKLLDNWEKN